MCAALIVMSLMCATFVTILFKVRDRLLSCQKADLKW
jgi:NitT/TauT family transport system permease protein